MTLKEARDIISKNDMKQAIQVLKDYEWLDEENVDDDTLALALMNYLNNEFDNILEELGLWVEEVSVSV